MGDITGDFRVSVDQYLGNPITARDVSNYFHLSAIYTNWHLSLETSESRWIVFGKPTSMRHVSNVAQAAWVRQQQALALRTSRGAEIEPNLAQ